MVWDLQNGSSLYRLQGELSIWTMGAAADGRWAVTCGDEYARVYSESIFSTDLLIWELEPGVRPITLKETRGGLIENRYTAAAILPDGKRALIARQDDEFPGKPASYQVWAFETHKKIQEWEIAGERIHCLLPLTEQSFLAGGQKLKLWDMSSKPPNARILLDEPVIALAISPDRNRWAAATGGKQVILWDTHLLQPLFSLDAQAVYANSLAFVLVGQGLAILHDDQALRIWDLETRQVKAIFYGESELTSLSAGLDGTSLLVGEKSGRVHILRLEGWGIIWPDKLK